MTKLAEYIRRNYPQYSQGDGGWVGVDFDGTLAKYESGRSMTDLNVPVAEMQETVLDLLNAGYEVKIMTARVGPQKRADDVDFIENQKRLLTAWCEEHLGRPLEITCQKDFRMILLLDDRAIRIKCNEGVPTLLD